MRATAALLEQPGQPFVLTEVDLEEPRPDEVLVRVAAVGICGTDLEFATFFPTPALLGHEGSGIVEKVGAHVTSVRPGDHVAMSFASCGTCTLCRTGSPAYCRGFDAVNFSGRRPDGSTAVRHEGREVNAHFLGQSSFAYHVVAPERAVVRIDPSLDLLRAGPFGCGFQTGAAWRAQRIAAAPGLVDRGVRGGCRRRGRHHRRLAERLRGRHRRRREPGQAGGGPRLRSHAHRRLLGRGSAAQLAALVPDGFDFVIDTTGREDVLRTAVEALGPLGRAGVIGIGPSESMTFEWRSILNGRSVTGIIGGSSLPQVFLPQLLKLNAEGRFPVEKMITYFPFEQINEAVAAVRSGSVGKAVLTF